MQDRSCKQIHHSKATTFTRNSMGPMSDIQQVAENPPSASHHRISAPPPAFSKLVAELQSFKLSQSSTGR
ncbi:hypothetical protein EV2_027730 [Malus domestica]